MADGQYKTCSKKDLHITTESVSAVFRPNYPNQDIGSNSDSIEKMISNSNRILSSQQKNTVLPAAGKCETTNINSQNECEFKRHSPVSDISSPKSEWSRQYGNKYRFVPILDDPFLLNSRRGRIRICQRGTHNGSGPHRFILNWYEDGRNCKRAILGDKFTAVAEADRINLRLELLGRSGIGCRNVSLPNLIEQYCEHLQSRADAGEISPRTVVRYQNALNYLRRYAEEASRVSLKNAGKIDDQFALGFKVFLNRLQIHLNGHPHTSKKPISPAGVRFILSADRALWHWAQQQNPPLLPGDVRNPFQGYVAARPEKDLVARQDMDTDDIVKLVEAADRYQFVLLLPMILYGLRAAEPFYLMIEDWNQETRLLSVNCHVDLEYRTKGRINKCFPVPLVLDRLFSLISEGRSGGPLFLSRGPFEGRQVVSPLLATKQHMPDEYCHRIEVDRSASKRGKVLAILFQEAGGIFYNQLSREFQQMVHCARLPENRTTENPLPGDDLNLIREGRLPQPRISGGGRGIKYTGSDNIICYRRDEYIDPSECEDCEYHKENEDGYKCIYNE